MTKISYLNRNKIIENKDEKYIVKNYSNCDIQKYLRSKGFFNFLEPIEITNDVEVYNYLEDIETTKTDKAQELIHLVALMHNKTTTFEKVSVDEIEKVYQRLNDKINKVYNYYLSEQERIENIIYMAPCEYLLIRNVSNIYKLLKFSKLCLEKYYEEIMKVKEARHVLLHNDLKLDNLVKTEKAYLTNFEKAKRGNVIHDFVNFYKNEMNNLDMSTLYNLYQRKYSFSKPEDNLFFTLISIPEIIEYKNNNYVNTVIVRRLVDYVDETMLFISEEYKEDQKTNKEEFKEKNNSVKPSSNKN